tara:strand:+ start:216 stop:872 length:657 start_codon:yes stop_codon:yes gene_type:complete
MLRKIRARALLLKMQKSFRNGQKKYALDYLLKPSNLCRFIKQGDLLQYCDNRRSIETNRLKPNYRDNSRSIELLRKDIKPLEWTEVIKDRELWFRHSPNIKKYHSEKTLNLYKRRNNGFTTEIIRKKMENCKYKCEITGLSSNESCIAADHFIPKEKGGNSKENNCIIINKILNEKKNRHDPIDWFCKHLLTNFMNICKRMGILDTCKTKIKNFIDEF